MKMSLVFGNRKPTAEQYNTLRINSGKGATVKEECALKAINNSLFFVSVFEEDRLVGYLRIVGDGGVTFCVTDVMVDREFQRRGIANHMMDIADQFLEENADENGIIMLIARKPSDGLYAKHGFRYLEDFRTGMLKHLKG